MPRQRIFRKAEREKLQRIFETHMQEIGAVKTYESPTMTRYEAVTRYGALDIAAPDFFSNNRLMSLHTCFVDHVAAWEGFFPGVPRAPYAVPVTADGPSSVGKWNDYFVPEDGAIGFATRLVERWARIAPL